MKTFLISVIFVSCSFKCCAQNLDQKLFDSLCKGIVNQSEYQLIKSRIKKSIQIVTNPISGKSLIRYDENLDSFAIDFRNRYSEELQRKILLTDYLPDLYLTDTTFIYDSLNFFSDNIFCFNNGYLFIKTSKRNYKAKKYILSLHSVGIRKNELILPFTNHYNSDIYCFCFSFLNNETSLKRTYFLDSRSKE